MVDFATEALSDALFKLRDFIHLTMAEHPGVEDFTGKAPTPPAHVQAAYDVVAETYGKLEKARQGLVMAAYCAGTDADDRPGAV